MYKGIENAHGEKLGEMTVQIDDPPVLDDVINFKGEIQMEDKKSTLKIPRYQPASGWIPAFGLPPFNEFIGVPDLNEMEKKFSDDAKYEEEIKVQKKGVHGIEILLNRTKNDKKETYKIREFLVPSGRSVGLTTISHEDGKCRMVIERDIASNRAEINNLEKKLEKPFKTYLKDVKREEGIPTVAILKRVEIDGKRPPIYSELFPFWEKESYDKDEIQILEIGYLDYGDNKTDADKIHGRWYKLYEFSNFDHDYLELREGDWRSKEIEFEGETQSTLAHYKRNLYKY